MAKMAGEHAALFELSDEERAAMVSLDKALSFGKLAGRHYTYAQAILESKQHDYGPTNISQAPGGALNGLRVRMHDKMARINNLIDNGATPEHESLKDSFLDLANYSIIAMMVLDGDWPDE